MESFPWNTRFALNSTPNAISWLREGQLVRPGTCTSVSPCASWESRGLRRGRSIRLETEESQSCHEPARRERQKKGKTERKTATLRSGCTIALFLVHGERSTGGPPKPALK